MDDTRHDGRFTPQFAADAASSVFWILMDLAWMSEWRLAGIILIVPTALASLSLYAFGERDFTGIMATTALCGWVGMNACWMMTDFGPWPSGIAFARAFFALSALCIVAAFLGAGDKTAVMARLSARLKRFRLDRKR